MDENQIDDLKLTPRTKTAIRKYIADLLGSDENLKIKSISVISSPSAKKLLPPLNIVEIAFVRERSWHPFDSETSTAGILRKWTLVVNESNGRIWMISDEGIGAEIGEILAAHSVKIVDISDASLVLDVVRDLRNSSDRPLGQIVKASETEWHLDVHNTSFQEVTFYRVNVDKQGNIEGGEWDVTAGGTVE